MYNGNNVSKRKNKRLLSNLKNKVLILILVIVALVLVFLLINSSKDNSSNYKINIYPTDEIELSIGDSIQLKANIEKINNANFIWESNNENIAIIDNNGNVTGIECGIAVITATYMDNSSIKMVKNVKVSQGDLNVALTDVSFENGDLLMPLNSNYTIGLNLIPTNGYIGKKEFTSSDNSVVTIDNKGNIKSIDYGNATISVSVNSGAFKKNLKVYVSSDYTKPELVINPENISFDSDLLKIKVGNSEQLKYVMFPDNVDKSRLNFISSDTSIVTIDSNGVLTAVKEGQAVIIVQAINGVSDTIDIEVLSDIVEVTDIEISSNNLTLKTGQSTTITPTILPDNASNKTLSFSASDPSIISVAPNSMGTQATITAIKSGKTTLVIKSNNGIQKNISVSVSSSSSSSTQSITPSITCPSVQAGSRVTCTIKDGTLQSAVTINDTNKAKIYSTGTNSFIIQGVDAGTTSGYATVAGKKVNFNITVTSAPKLTTNPSISCPSVQVGSKVTCTIKDGTLQSAVTINDTNKAKIYSTGTNSFIIQGVNTGTTTGYVTVDGKKVSFSITITSKKCIDIGYAEECRNNGCYWDYTGGGQCVTSQPVQTPDPKITCKNPVFNGNAQTVAICENGKFTDGYSSHAEINVGKYDLTCNGTNGKQVKATCELKANPSSPDPVITCRNPIYDGHIKTIADCSNGIFNNGYSFYTASAVGSYNITCYGYDGKNKTGKTTTKSCSIYKSLDDLVGPGETSTSTSPSDPKIICKNPVFNGNAQIIATCENGTFTDGYSSAAKTNVGKYDLLCNGTNGKQVRTTCELKVNPSPPDPVITCRNPVYDGKYKVIADCSNGIFNNNYSFYSSSNSGNQNITCYGYDGKNKTGKTATKTCGWSN